MLSRSQRRLPFRALLGSRQLSSSSALALPRRVAPVSASLFRLGTQLAGEDGEWSAGSVERSDGMTMSSGKFSSWFNPSGPPSSTVSGRGKRDALASGSGGKPIGRSGGEEEDGDNQSRDPLSSKSDLAYSLPENFASKFLFSPPTSPKATPPPTASSNPPSASESPKPESTHGESSGSSHSEPASKSISSTSKPRIHPYYLESLRNALLTSFLPTNQFPPPLSGFASQPQSIPSTSSLSHPHWSDPTIALVCPLEGSEHLLREAIFKAAEEVNADVVRLETMECLGMRSEGGLGQAGECLRLKNNPLLISEPDPPSSYPSDSETIQNGGEEEEEGLDEHEESEDAHVVTIPLGLSLPFGPPGGPIPGSSRTRSPGPFSNIRQAMASGRSDRVEKAKDRLFRDIVDINPKEKVAVNARPRIIYVQDATAMASTFSQWYPSLMSAVRNRRKNTGPTTVVLGCSPSLLHTGPNLGQQKQSGEIAFDSENNTPHLLPLAEFLARFRSGGSGGPSLGEKATEELWMSSAEDDISGRRKRLNRRLERLRSSDEKGLRSLLPAFEEQPDRRSTSGAGIDLSVVFGGGMSPSNSAERDDLKEPVKIWKVLGVLPLSRNTAAERKERHSRRLELNTLLLKKAVSALGGRLTTQYPADELNEKDETSREHILREISSIRDSFASTVWPWVTLKHLASISVGWAAYQILNKSKLPWTLDTRPVVDWEAIAAASIAEERGEVQKQLWMSKHVQAPTEDTLTPKARAAKDSTEAFDLPRKDPVIEAIKNDRKLPQHEKRLLSCIVDTDRLLATSFKDVHLPEKTIDGIRSMVSLPLLYPEAFKEGVLAQHTTTGALLFGPPGTGKSHLIRALARGSGARMLAIQPSDVNDMYVGEGEKLVKAVFTLARKLAPCIVFLDEVDSLFGARSGTSGSGGSQSHRQILTEFMQEMDGLTSASANKNQVIVIGATNRPYDLDEAVLRRLPRRMLVDLPGLNDREAILRILLRDEKLASDVDLSKIAKATDTYSGSDLKHLCVQAALAAVQESVKLPWKDAELTTAPITPTSASREHIRPFASPQAKSAEPHHPQQSTIPSRESEKAPLLRSSAQESLRGEVKAVKKAVVGVRGVVKNPAVAMIEEEYLRCRAEKTTDGDSTTSKGKSYVLSANDVDQELEWKLEELEHEPPSEEGTRASKSALDRTLHMRHFERAMKEITPSSSEGGNLSELRKWNERYGEGGTERGKKQGYGSKFGFGDLHEAAKDDPSYGRVRPGE